MTSEADGAAGVDVQETGAGRFQVEVRVGVLRFLADEPAEVGGLSSGPNPYDLLCSALGTCTVMTLRLYAERKGWPLVRAGVTVLHSRAGLQARDRFAREIRLEGPLSDGQTRRLMEIAERCPVHRTLESGADIITVLTRRPPQERLEALSLQHGGDMAEVCDACEAGEGGGPA